MPRTLKRRSDAISRDASPSGTASPEPPRRRQHSSSSSSQSEADAQSQDEDANTQAATQQATLVKKLVRLALATSYSRQPLRRADVSSKILKDANANRQFKPIFSQAQKTLRHVFGMELVELPSKEKTSLKDRRTQATAPKSSTTTSSKSWVLVSTLPKEYKTNPTIMHPSRAPSDEIESGYTALYTFIVAVIYLNNNEIPEAKLERYLKRMNADVSTPFGSYEKVMQRMVREGYVERRKEGSSEGDVVSYVVGPRGKVEVGVTGVEGLVKAVYGDEGMGMTELNQRLTRSLGVSISGEAEGSGEVDGEEEGAGQREVEAEQPQQRRSVRRRGARDPDDDD